MTLLRARDGAGFVMSERDLRADFTARTGIFGVISLSIVGDVGKVGVGIGAGIGAGCFTSEGLGVSLLSRKVKVVGMLLLAEVGSGRIFRVCFVVESWEDGSSDFEVKFLMPEDNCKFDAVCRNLVLTMLVDRSFLSLSSASYDDWDSTLRVSRDWISFSAQFRQRSYPSSCCGIVVEQSQ